MTAYEPVEIRRCSVEGCERNSWLNDGPEDRCLLHINEGISDIAPADTA